MCGHRKFAWKHQILFCLDSNVGFLETLFQRTPHLIVVRVKVQCIDRRSLMKTYMPLSVPWAFLWKILCVSVSPEGNSVKCKHRFSMRWLSVVSLLLSLSSPNYQIARLCIYLIEILCTFQFTIEQTNSVHYSPFALSCPCTLLAHVYSKQHVYEEYE